MPVTNQSQQEPGLLRTLDDRARPITQLAPGDCGRVREVRAVDAEIERLMTMGVCEGRKVMLVRRGDPLILWVLGTRIGVSARLAERIRVVPCPNDEPDR